MRSNILYILLLISIQSSVDIFSQDMDAGISSMGRRDLRLNKDRDESKFIIANNLGFSGKDPIDGSKFTVNTITAEGDAHIYKSSRIYFKLAYGITAGPIATEKGPGDMIWLFYFDVPLPIIGDWNVSMGSKFSSGSATLDGLPVVYQPGLGTNDMLLGFGRNFGIANIYFGYQKPFGRSNNAATQLRRGDDVMFRAGITQPFKEGFFQAEILGIKRIQKSNVLVIYSDPQQYIDVEGSNELQLNVLGKVSVQTSKNINIEALVALPLLTRDSNIDGLKRAFSISLSAVFYFKLD
jgi:hypothetical protein